MVELHSTTVQAAKDEAWSRKAAHQPHGFVSKRAKNALVSVPAVNILLRQTTLYIHMAMSPKDTHAETVTCRDVSGTSHVVPVGQLRWRPAAYGIVAKDGAILLLKQFGGKYDLPGGGVNIGEDPKDAVIREVLEETGITVKDPTSLGVESSLFHDTHGSGKFYHSLLLYFHCEYVHGELSLEGLEEIEKQYVEEAEWVLVSRLRDIEISSTVDFRPYIRQYMSEDHKSQ